MVTGGAGFIGSHLVEGLVERGFEVSVVDDLSTGRIENLSSCLARIRFVRGDIRDKATLAGSVQHVDSVLHLAAIASVPYSVEHPEATCEVNVDGTRNLLDASLFSADRFVYVSSSAVYGDPEYLPVDEDHPLRPISPYAESKLKAEQICREYQESYGLKATILRPFNVYGPRQSNNQYAGVIAKFIERLREGSPPIIYGDGLQTRDFVYVVDAARASILAMQSDEAAGRIINIATGVPTTINHLAQLLVEMLGVGGIEPHHLGARQGDIRHSYADTREARTRLGFETQISLKEGLSSLLEWAKHA
ncbi:MAG: GDP-mannose 4,6-dehydratase [Candidatus Bathyarchaeota archaeon]|nr:GDP-mannose 4,6-dehydratase [Candidatus Bathyarchaeota archaeon]